LPRAAEAERRREEVKRRLETAVETGWNFTNNRKAALHQAAFPLFVSIFLVVSLLLLAEPEAVLHRVHEPIDHDADVARVLLDNTQDVTAIAEAAILPTLDSAIIA
jgi:hypothetical protein